MIILRQRSPEDLESEVVPFLAKKRGRLVYLD
jgi:hypothetical protein